VISLTQGTQEVYGICFSAKQRLEEKRKADELKKREEEHQKELNRRNEGGA